MKRHSKSLAVLLLLALALACLAGCGGTQEPSAEDTPAVTDDPAAGGGEAAVFRMGQLDWTNISAEELGTKIAEISAPDEVQLPFSIENVYFDTLSSMLLALQAGQIDLMTVPTAVAEYIVAGSDALTLASGPPAQQALSLAVLEDKTELLAQLNDAIAALQADGTIDALAAAHINGASPGAEVTPVTIPVIEGADTVKVAVTGDMPPIDYVSADGQPSGFNIALLSAISRQAGVNIELISIDSGARVLALTSGRADVVFWMRSEIWPDGSVNNALDAPPGVALTDHYYTDTLSAVRMK